MQEKAENQNNVSVNSSEVDKYPVSFLTATDTVEGLKAYVNQQKEQYLASGMSELKAKQQIAQLVSAPNEIGMTPLHWLNVVTEESFGVAKVLVENGANVNALSDNKNLPIHVVAMKTCSTLEEYAQREKELAELASKVVLQRSLPIFDLLIAAGSHLGTKSHQGKTPMQHLTSVATQAVLDEKCTELSLPHLQKAVDEYFASARKSRDPSGHSTDSSDRHSSENEDPISSPVIPVKTRIQHSGRNSKAHTAKTTANDEKKHCCIMM